VGYLYANFGLPRPLRSRLRPDVRDRQTDVRRASSLNAPRHNNWPGTAAWKLISTSAVRSIQPRQPRLWSSLSCAFLDKLTSHDYHSCNQNVHAKNWSKDCSLKLFRYWGAPPTRSSFSGTLSAWQSTKRAAHKWHKLGRELPSQRHLRRRPTS